MTFTEAVYGLGDFFLKSFKIIKKLGGMPNVLIIIAIFLSVCVWVWMMSRYNKEAEEKGTLK